MCRRSPLLHPRSTGMTTNEWRERARDFETRFGAAPEAAVRVPGRVNLIGDHTDYHEGFVLPMAINRAIFLLGRRRSDRRLRVYSHVLGAGFDIDFDVAERHPESWPRYFQGVVSVLAQRHALASGCDVLIDADLPPGGGLSSSSALVVGFGALLLALHALEHDSLSLATLGRDAEHWYGTTGGIMDQFVISHGRAGQAVLLDCRTLTHEYVPVPDAVSVVIANTETRHDQIVSPFARRREQAEAGLRVIQGRDPVVRTLRDVTPETLEQHRQALQAADPSGVLWRRCEHVVTENSRVLAAGQVLGSADLAAMGKLMAASHASLRDNYEVS